MKSILILAMLLASASTASASASSTCAGERKFNCHSMAKEGEPIATALLFQQITICESNRTFMLEFYGNNKSTGFLVAGQSIKAGGTSLFVPYKNGLAAIEFTSLESAQFPAKFTLIQGTEKSSSSYVCVRR